MASIGLRLGVLLAIITWLIGYRGFAVVGWGLYAVGLMLLFGSFQFLRSTWEMDVDGRGVQILRDGDERGSFVAWNTVTAIYRRRSLRIGRYTAMRYRAARPLRKRVIGFIISWRIRTALALLDREVEPHENLRRHLDHLCATSGD